jgi:hypothetical protein
MTTHSSAAFERCDMHRTIHIPRSAGLLAVLAALVAACGGSGAPSTAASLQGTVRTSNGSAAPGVLATVAGSRLSALTDGAGQFSIDGAPEGPATLRLESSGVNASLAVPRLGRNMVVRVSVRLTDDGRGELEHEPEAEFTGTIASISGSDLVVSGQTVHTDAQTFFRVNGVAGTLAQLTVGTNVEVEGLQQADGTLLARQVKTEDDASGADHELEFRGKIEAKSGTDLTVSGRPVHTNAQTVVDGHGATRLADLQIGANVEVHAAAQTDGSALATRIHIED